MACGLGTSRPRALAIAWAARRHISGHNVRARPRLQASEIRVVFWGSASGLFWAYRVALGWGYPWHPLGAWGSRGWRLTKPSSRPCGFIDQEAAFEITWRREVRLVLYR